MPTRLPAVRWTHARPAERSTRIFDLSCAVFGAAAIGLAIFVDQCCCDRTGALLVLLMAAGLIAVLMHGLSRGPLEREGRTN